MNKFMSPRKGMLNNISHIREFANNVSQMLLAKVRNIINQYGRKPLGGGGGGGGCFLRTAFELGILQVFLFHKLGIISH